MPNNNASVPERTKHFSKSKPWSHGHALRNQLSKVTPRKRQMLSTSVGWQVYKSREALAKLAVEEGGFARASPADW